MEKGTNTWNAICIYIGKYLILILKLNNNNKNQTNNIRQLMNYKVKI